MADKSLIDETDKKILYYLSRNARMPFLEIARECGISGAAIHQRVKKLEDNGVIEGSRFIVKPQALNLKVCAYVGVQLAKADRLSAVIEELGNIKEVVECHFITGKYALLVKVFCKDNEKLMEILVNTFQNIDGVSSTETFISLDQAIDRQIEI